MKAKAENGQDQDREVLVHGDPFLPCDPLPGHIRPLVRRPTRQTYDALVTAPDETPPTGPAKKAPSGQAPAKKADQEGVARPRRRARPRSRPAKKTAASEVGGQEGARPRRRRRPSAARRPGRPPRPGESAAATKAAPTEHVHDVVVVGAGPAGSSCAYWLADAGWDVVRGGEEALPPREDLRRRAHAPRGAPAGRHGARGRAGRARTATPGCGPIGFGHSIEMQWPEHPHFPSYGYTITRHDLDGLVAGRAAKAGATLLQGTEVIAPIVVESAPAAGSLATLSGVLVKEKGSRETRPIQARYVVVADGSNSRFGRMLGTDAPARPAHGHGAARLLPLRAPRRPVHRVPPRHPRRRGQRGPRLRLDLPHGRRPGQRRRGPPVDRRPLEGRQHHRTSWTPSSTTPRRRGA